MKVDKYDYKYHKVGEAFSNVCARWYQEPWVKYLYQHATINTMETYEDAESYGDATIYAIHWKIDSKKSIICMLTWADEINKIYT